MSSLRFLAIAIVLATSQVAAQTPPASGEGPAPLSRQFPCDAFIKKPDGAWQPNRDVNIELPDKRVITVGPAASFTPGSKVGGGPDIGSVIERECGTR